MTSVQSDKMVDKQARRMISNMEELRQQQCGTDITMECIGGSVYAHKLCLIASCPYFEKMLTTNMCEKSSGHINFKNYSKEVIEIIIRYLYTGQLPNLSKDYIVLKELIQTCHMMEIGELFNHSWNEKKKYLSVETFAEVWAFALKLDLCKPNGTIENYAKTNIEKISEFSKLSELDENQMGKLIECVNDKQYIRSCIKCIFKWNQNGTRDECAAKLLQKNLKFLNDTDLNKFLKSYKPKPTLHGILTNLALDRLCSSDMVRYDYLRFIKSLSNKRCNLFVDGSLKCPAEVELAKIKVICDTLSLNL